MPKTMMIAMLGVCLLGDPGFAAAQVNAPEPGPALATSLAAIHFKNELGKTMTLVEVQVTLDGAELPVVSNLSPDQDVVVFSGPITPGHHFVTTRVVCRGNGRGPVSYLKDYRWIATGNQVLTVPENRAVVYTLAARRLKGANFSWNKPIEILVRDRSSIVGEPFTN